MKYDRLVVCGESYMEPFVIAKGHYELAKRLGISKTKWIVHPGSAIDQVARTLIDYVLTNKHERMLIVWGLTFPSRFDLLVTLKEDYPFNAQYISYNGNSFNAVSPDEIHDYDRLLEAARVINETRSFQHDLRLKEFLNKVITTVALMKSIGHDCVVYSQVKIKEKEFDTNVPQQRYIEQNSEFIDIFNLQVNEYLQTKGAEPDPKDLERYPHLDRATAHLLPNKALVDALCDFICEQYNRIYT